VVKIESPGFAELRPGLSAEVNFLVESRPRVTRIPLQVVRWASNKPYVAVARDPKPTENAAGTDLTSRFDWQPVALGLSDTTHFEVISGLKPGAKLIAHPETLPPPASGAARSNVAVNETRPQG